LSQRSLYREFWKVVEAADVLLEVLDARDPLGCRCTDVEEAIRARHPEKKVLLVLNKIDLVPKSVVEEWAAHLKNELPTVLFKSSTNSSKGSKSGKLRHSTVDPALAPRGLLESSQCIGADLLMHMLKNYSRREGQSLKTAITVGIIGYPNVGKSSVINSLRRVKSVEVGGQAGVTRVMQEIKLDSKVKLLDCPGAYTAIRPPWNAHSWALPFSRLSLTFLSLLFLHRHHFHIWRLC
jgi:nuclear GTP-binding protein